MDGCGSVRPTKASELAAMAFARYTTEEGYLERGNAVPGTGETGEVDGWINEMGGFYSWVVLGAGEVASHGPLLWCTCKSPLLRIRSHSQSCVASVHCSIHCPEDGNK